MPIMKQKYLWLASVVVGSLLFVACSSDGDEADTEEQDGGIGKKDAAAYVPPTGEPITADDMTWTWVPFPESRCRDGSSTGIGVNLNSASNKVMVYLQGGGACYNSLTCLANPASFSGTGVTWPTGGVFNRNNPDNPIKEWNYVYVPYCTGDVHAGDNEVDPGTGQVQNYHGYKNLELFLDRVVPTFPDVTDVLYAGESAGGFGAAITADLAGRKFPPTVTFRLIDDSGPPMSSEYLPTCLQKQWREVWGFDGTVLADCGSSCPNPDDYALDWSMFLSKKFASTNAAAGVISATADSVITLFYGFGNNNCSGFGIVPADVFQAGLLDFRERMKDVPKFGTYYINSTNHTWIGNDNTFYTTTAGDVRLVDWVRDIVEGKKPTHVGP